MAYPVRVSQMRKNRKGIPEKKIVVKRMATQSVKGSKYIRVSKYKRSSVKQGGAGNEAGETERRQHVMDSDPIA